MRRGAMAPFNNSLVDLMLPSLDAIEGRDHCFARRLGHYPAGFKNLTLAVQITRGITISIGGKGYWKTISRYV